MPRQMIRWRLKEVMARHNIKAIDLAREMGVDTNTVSNLRVAETMPRINGERLNELCYHLNRLRGIPDELISPATLIEYEPEPELYETT